MKSIPVSLAVVALTLGQGGCGTHLYKQWDHQLVRMCADEAIQGRFYTVEDVSLLLGTPPVDCETFDGPTSLAIGVICDIRAGEQVVPRVAAVVPKSPADLAGLRSGDLVVSVDGTAVASVAEARRVVDTQAAPGKPVILVTDRGTFEVVPEKSDYQQCYWSIEAGPVGQAAGSSTWTGNGGAAYYGATAYQRYYRSTCRFVNGRLYTFTSNWQM